jgi:hypothetical protein
MKNQYDYMIKTMQGHIQKLRKSGGKSDLGHISDLKQEIARLTKMRKKWYGESMNKAQELIALLDESFLGTDLFLAKSRGGKSAPKKKQVRKTKPKMVAPKIEKPVRKKTSAKKGKPMPSAPKPNISAVEQSRFDYKILNIVNAIIGTWMSGKHANGKKSEQGHARQIWHYQHELDDVMDQYYKKFGKSYKLSKEAKADLKSADVWMYLVNPAIGSGK